LALAYQHSKLPFVGSNPITRSKPIKVEQPEQAAAPLRSITRPKRGASVPSARRPALGVVYGQLELARNFGRPGAHRFDQAHSARIPLAGVHRLIDVLRLAIEGDIGRVVDVAGDLFGVESPSRYLNLLRTGVGASGFDDVDSGAHSLAFLADGGVG